MFLTIPGQDVVEAISVHLKAPALEKKVVVRIRLFSQSSELKTPFLSMMTLSRLVVFLVSFQKRISLTPLQTLMP